MARAGEVVQECLFRSMKERRGWTWKVVQDFVFCIQLCIQIVQGFGLIALTCVRLIKIRSQKIQLLYNRLIYMNEFRR